VQSHLLLIVGQNAKQKTGDRRIEGAGGKLKRGHIHLEKISSLGEC